MNVFRSIIFSAVLAGLITGIVVTGAQMVSTVPLILKAEVFEVAEPAAPADAGHSHAPGTAAHSHDEEAWGPEDGFERNAYTALINVVSWIGFGMLMAGVFVLSRRDITWREGFLWGLGGFAAFILAPTLGLPPELPGMPAGDLVARQVWWIGTVAATAVGLYLIALQRSPLAAVAAIVLIALPHVIGAPQPESHDSAVPHGLHHEFVVAVTLTTLLSWSLLGGLTGLFYRRFSATA
ncbi:CbtA family protein [Lacibacterium aquatile]|uniref:CbtA family protein n=1 Tax=Lacibacterium aquatile TaxID=1168082 RepID=A0ABW5DSZ8_9PROT